MTDNTDFQKLRALKENYAARLAKMSFEGREKTLVDADAINTRHAQRCMELTTSILGISSLAARLAEEQDARTVEDLFSAELCNSLKDDTHETEN